MLQLGSTIGLYGAERWILALIKNLDKAIIESWVGVVRDDRESEVLLCRKAEKLGFNSTIFESKGRWIFSAVKHLNKFILARGINIIHTHGYKTDLIGLLAISGTSCKIVTTLHGWTKQPDIKLFMYESLDRLILPFFDAVVALSDLLYMQARRIPGLKKKIYLILNGVDTSEVESLKKISNEVVSWRKENSFMIGYIGRLTPGKGIDVLLKALANFGNFPWQVGIVGEGEQLFELRSMVRNLNIENHVKFFGFRTDRLEYLKGFDVFVLPSRSEGIPRCLMEAMLMGIPVIASNIPGCRYLVDGNKTGLLFEVDKPKMLADSLKRLRFDSTLREFLSANGRKFIKKHFSADRMAYEYLQLYLELVGK